MSTLLYEALTNAREATKPTAALQLEAVKPDSEKVSKPVPKLLDSVAALVPVEVLAAHAALLGVVSETSDPGDKGPVVVTIINEAWATRFWIALVVAAVLFYAVPHLIHHGWDRWDFFRAAIPAGAFVAWTMLQQATLFDSVSDWSRLTQVGVGVFVGLVALLLSRTLAETAEEKTPQADQAATLNPSTPVVA